MKKKYYLVLLGVLAFLAVFNISFAASSPGSESDPLITSSYLDKKIQDLTSSFQGMIKNLEDKVNQNNSNLSVMDKKVEALSNQSDGTGTGSIFEVINVPSGKKLIGESSTEIILRSGKVKAFSSNISGLSDVTSGSDIIPGAAVEKNHLLIVPRTDGRGISAETASVIMVKGKYTIE